MNPQVNLRVDEEQKEDWDAYVEESRRYSSLSDLIRAAVETEINKEDTEITSSSPALANDVQKLTEDLERVRKDVRWLREQEQDTTDISELAQDLFAELEPLPQPSGSPNIPSDVDDEETRLQQLAASQVIEPDDSEDATVNGQTEYTTNALAERLDTPEDRIRDALDHLEDNFLPVVAVELDEETHYFKEE